MPWQRAMSFSTGTLQLRRWDDWVVNHLMPSAAGGIQQIQHASSQHGCQVACHMTPATMHEKQPRFVLWSLLSILRGGTKKLRNIMRVKLTMLAFDDDFRRQMY
jgi:hypothetical protein